MTRIDIIDKIRGFSFIPMFIFHIFSTYDLVNLFSTHTSGHPVIEFLGLIRNVYILLVGVSLALSTKKHEDKKDYYFMRLKRSIHIFFHALIITIITHYLFGNIGIKFGVLHFIALGTLLLSPIADNIYLILLFFVLSLVITYPKINPFFDTITGAKIHYSTPDWFPLNSKLPLMIGGLIIGHLLYSKTDKIKKEEKDKLSILEWMGKHSLELYTGHIIGLIIIFYLLKKYKVI